MNSHISVVLDTRKIRKGGKYTLVLRLTHKRQTTSITTRILLSKQDWNEEKREVRAGYKGIDSASRLNNDIRQKLAAASNVIRSLDESGILLSLTISELQKRITGFEEDPSFLSYTEKQIETLRATKHFGNARAYHSMLLAIKKFRGGQDLKFSELNPRFLRQFEADYLSRGSLNGLSAILRAARAIYNKALLEKIITTVSPFKEYRIRKEKTVKRALSQEAIAKIIDIQLDETHPCFHARNYFLFSYGCCGMNFSDMAHLTLENIVDGRVQYFRKKTNIPYSIKLLDSVRPILDYYTKDKTAGDHIFPILKRSTPSEQDKDVLWARKTYNKRLKELATLCEIEQNLTSYVSRHSFATLAMQLEIPIQAISKMLGHTNLSTTEIYLKGLPNSVIDGYHDLIDFKKK